ncbi:hypothetical protein OROMI_014946 [Orobanche minor]
MSASSSSQAVDAAATAALRKKRNDIQNSVLRWYTVRNDKLGVLKILEQDNNLANARDFVNRTPLHLASIYGCTDVARCLIDNKADVNAEDYWKNTPLAEAEGAMDELEKKYGKHYKTLAVAADEVAKISAMIHLLKSRGGISKFIGKGSNLELSTQEAEAES